MTFCAILRVLAKNMVSFERALRSNLMYISAKGALRKFRPGGPKKIETVESWGEGTLKV